VCAALDGECQAGSTSAVCLSPVDAHEGSTATRVADTVFLCVVVLATACLAARLFGGRSRAARRQFVVGFTLGAMVLVQVVCLFRAAMRLSPHSANAKESLTRWDCAQSTKGGKASSLAGSGAAADARLQYADNGNPCFCKAPLNCRVPESSEWNVDSGVECPSSCYDERHDPSRRIVPSLSTTRDCAKGAGAKCTKSEPCTPCKLETLEAFGAPRCATCTDVNRGDCGFVEGEGPYCRLGPDSDEVGPCTKCCTEPVTQSGNSLCFGVPQ